LDKLTLLFDLYGSIIVPPACLAEIACGLELGIPLPDPSTINWIKILEPQTGLIPKLNYSLGDGELEVLALGLERVDSLLILDDMFARKYAAFLKLRFTGTLGVLLDAKGKGLLDLVQPNILALRQLGFRMSAETEMTVLRLAGES